MTVNLAKAPESLTRDRARTLFGQTMGLVAGTAGTFALGAYVAGDASAGWTWLFLFAALGVLIGMSAAVKRSEQWSVGLLLSFGFLLGAGVASTVAYYARADPQAFWQAAGATGLFVAAFGALGYSTRRDLSNLARGLTWALVGLIVFGIVEIFTHIPNGEIIYSVVGLVIFAGLIAFDFQRLRNSTDMRTAPLLAASIFLDILNVFLFLPLLRRGRVTGARPTWMAPSTAQRPDQALTVATTYIAEVTGVVSPTAKQPQHNDKTTRSRQ